MEKPLPDVKSFLPFWEELTQEHQDDLLRHSLPRRFEKGTVVMPYKGECPGLILVQRGRLRAYVLSEGGKEVTLYRLHERDICLFSAACSMNNIRFDIRLEAERDTLALLVPAGLYQRLTAQSAAAANYTNQLMASRFSDVMWVLEQVVFKSMDCRLAQTLLEHAGNEGKSELSITHDALARDLGSAREVVTRLLKYFRGEGLLELARGHILLLDKKRLQGIARG